MTEAPWLDGYAGQSTDELLALRDMFRTDSIALAFEEAIRRKAARLGHGSLTREERVVLAVEALEREVNSDGYGGLFTTAADQVPDLVASLVAIGAGAVADLTGSAIAALGIQGPLTPEAIEAAMADDDDDRDDRLDTLDATYYETAGDLAEPLLEYIEANRDRIVLS